MATACAHGCTAALVAIAASIGNEEFCLVLCHPNSMTSLSPFEELLQHRRFETLSAMLHGPLKVLIHVLFWQLDNHDDNVFAMNCVFLVAGMVWSELCVCCRGRLCFHSRRH